MTTVTYTIPNINCHHCIHTIQNEVSEMDGVKTVEGDVSDKKVTILYDSPVTESQIIDLLTEINYPPKP